MPSSSVNISLMLAIVQISASEGADRDIVSFIVHIDVSKLFTVEADDLKVNMHCLGLSVGLHCPSACILRPHCHRDILRCQNETFVQFR